MTKEQRTSWQVYSAIAMLACGVALSVAGFIVPPLGDISDSVLWFFAQCLIYAGSIFGVSIYVQSKLTELRERIENELHTPLQDLTDAFEDAFEDNKADEKGCSKNHEK